MKIGNVNLANPYILAPMAGVTDLPFRLLCKEQGAGLLCMEMISAKALQYKNKNTKALLAIHPEEYPVSLQLFGSDPKIMSEMAKMIEELPFQILDINMGCPVPKVVRNGEGSALMKNPKLVHEIVSAVSKAIEKPVTVKIRKGFDDDHINAVEIAKIIEDAGGAAVAVHGRTREQYYSGKADWDIIRQLKEAGFKRIVMMTGDSERTAAAIAKRVGVDDYFSEVLPEDKARFVEEEKAKGHKVIMIGDGINDSPALSAADAGIAVSEGAEIAREIADITIKKDSLDEVVLLRHLSMDLMKRVHGNYRFVISFNLGLILLGVAGIITPSMSALLHNSSTLAISLKSMTNLLPEEEREEA